MWIKYFRKDIPNINIRLNPLIIDLQCEIDLSKITPIVAAIDAVNKIVKNYPPPYTLLVSGGVDSQVMALAWKHSGHPFKMVHYVYGEHSIAEDRTTLKIFCDKHNLICEYRNFDILSFIQSNELIQTAIKYDCSSPQILTYIKFIEQHSETVLLSGNNITALTCGLNYTILALDRFSKIKTNVIPFFLLSTPDLAYAFYNNDNIASGILINQSNNGNFNGYESKCLAYELSGFDIVRQDKKYTGFEQIKIYFDNHYIADSLKMKYGSFASKRPFDFNFRYRLYDTIGPYSEAVELIYK
jgi:hypothetical protein